MKGAKQILYDHLKKFGETSRTELRNIITRNNEDIATCDRALRKLTEMDLIEPVVGSKSFNKAYIIKQPKHVTVTHFEPNLTPRKPISVEDEYIYSLNARLKEIKVRYKPKFGDDIKSIFSEIDGAINSKYEYVKKGVLDKYQGEL